MVHIPTGEQGGDGGGIELRAALAVAWLVCSDRAGLTAQAMSLDGAASAGGVDTLPGLVRSDWWQATDATGIVAAYETACARHGLDPAARQAVDRIVDEMLGSYGVDVRETCADPAAVHLALAGCARFEREAAALDVADAAQDAARADASMRRGEVQRADAYLNQSQQLYRRADLRRRLARRLESALAKATR